MNTPESHEIMNEIGKVREDLNAINRTVSNRIDGFKEDFQGFVADLLTLKDCVADLANAVESLNKDVVAMQGDEK